MGTTYKNTSLGWKWAEGTGQPLGNVLFCKWNFCPVVGTALRHGMHSTDTNRENKTPVWFLKLPPFLP